VTRCRSLSALWAFVLVAGGLAVAATPAPALEPRVFVGYGEADSTWHVGAGAGQYTAKSTDSVDWIAGGEVDPHNHSTTQKNSYGVQSRLTYRAIVVQDAQGDQVAFVKSDSYLAMDYLSRRAGQILADRGSPISYDEIFHMASHNHSSPYYMTPSWGVWLFQDAFDLRAFEYHARAMADAIQRAQRNLEPARMGATKIDHRLFKGMIARRTVADDGTPAGYPLDFGDFGLDVIRFDSLLTDKPIAAMINWGQHPEGLDDHDLITGDFVAPLERFVERATGAPLVFGQGDVGSAEAGPGHPELIPKGIPRRWSHAGHAQAERGAFLLAQDAVRAWNAIGDGDALVPFSSNFDVAAGNAWVPGPLSHPYPSVSNCRTETTAEGAPGSPILGLPDCERGPGSADKTNMMWENLKVHGIPVPEHYDAPAFTGVEENLRLHLQAFKIGEVILMSCACEAQVDLILNLESRTDEEPGMLLGYDWTKRLDCTQTEEGGDWTCTRKTDDPASPGSTFADPVTFSDARYRRMRAHLHNDAAGWDLPENAIAANAEPSDPTKIWGNFTHAELPPDLGYKLPIGVGHAGDYNGYTVSYREYMAYDHYRKALTSYGSHTADYTNTRLVQLAAELNDGDNDTTFDYEDYDAPRAEADEVRQVATATALGQASQRAYDTWRAALPDDAGPAEALTQPGDIARFDATTFSWRGGSNAVDNPVVRVQRKVGEEWEPFADQSGEIQTKLQFPEGANGFFDTYSGNQQWIWTANFEAFDAFPAEIGSTPSGEYRFVVDGHIRTDGSDAPYHLESQPFVVRAWDGIEVEDFRLGDDGSVSFVVPPIKYPRTYASEFPYVAVAMKSESTDGEIPPDERGQFCTTCSFRPWATGAEIATAAVTVVRADQSTEQVMAARGEDGRWHAPADLFEGDVAFVDRGGVVDTYGEINGNKSGEVAGIRARTPAPPEPVVTVLDFTGNSAESGQYSDRTVFEARLTDVSGEPIADAPLVFELGTQTFDPVTTDDQGIASITPLLTEKPDTYMLTVRYTEDELYTGSAAVRLFPIVKEDAGLDLTIDGKGSRRTLVARLFDADTLSAGIAEVALEFFSDSDPIGGAETKENGVARLKIPPRYRGGHHTYEARFNGNDYYELASASKKT